MKNSFPFYSIGHFINEPNNPTQFEITRFAEMQEPQVDDLHKHTFYEIIWIEEGISRQIIDYQAYTIYPQSLFFISPGQLHYFEEWQPLQGGSIFFTEDFFLLNQINQDKLFELAFLDNFYINPGFQPRPSDYTEIKQIIDLLYTEKKRPDYLPTIAQSLLHILLAQIQRSMDSQTPQSTAKKYVITYKKFKNLIDVHFRTDFTAKDYAEQLHITQHHLNHIAKEITGKTATELIRARVILEAKRLLTFSDNTVSEIAYYLGFEENSYFTRVFRQEVGISPGEFRNQISEKYHLK
ncbi:MAG: AraC family transcriptional regulator [Microscillaceae bacterium]|jgi:AraC-like DNA-binding protein|nr:AraC family transcriptional regulator [Microscillaceae bacterium]